MDMQFVCLTCQFKFDYAVQCFLYEVYILKVLNKKNYISEKQQIKCCGLSLRNANLNLTKNKTKRGKEINIENYVYDIDSSILGLTFF